MAEIQLQRKQQGSWLWALVAVVVLALLAWWMFADRDQSVTAGGEPVPAVVTTAPGVPPVASDASVPSGAAVGAPVTAFLTWVDETGARRDAALDHEYVATGITRLAGAIASLAVGDSLGGSSVAQQAQALNRLAEQVQQDADALTHADVVHAAFESSAALLGDIQQRHYPAASGAVTDVRNAAAAISKQQPLLDQRAQVGHFFDEAAAAVRAMSPNA